MRVDLPLQTCAHGRRSSDEVTLAPGAFRTNQLVLLTIQQTIIRRPLSEQPAEQLTPRCRKFGLIFISTDLV